MTRDGYVPRSILIAIALAIIACLVMLCATTARAAFDPRVADVCTSLTTPTNRVFQSTGDSNIITNTTSDQTFTFANGVGSFTIAADKLTTGATWQMEVSGRFTAGVLLSNVELKLKGSGTTIFTSGAQSLPLTLTNRQFRARCRFTVSAVSSTQVTIRATGSGYMDNASLLGAGVTIAPTVATTTITKAAIPLTLTTVGNGSVSQGNATIEACSVWQEF